MLTRIMLGLVLLLLLLVLLMLLLMLLLLLLATVFADTGALRSTNVDKIHVGASLVVVVAVAVDAAAVVATVVAAGWEVFGLRCTLSVFHVLITAAITAPISLRKPCKRNSTFKVILSLRRAPQEVSLHRAVELCLCDTGLAGCCRA